MISQGTFIAVFIVFFGVLTGLIGIIYWAMNSKIDKKVDKESYDINAASTKHALDQINGTAKELLRLAESISKIHDTFMSRKEHEYEMALHEARKHGAG